MSDDGNNPRAGLPGDSDPHFWWIGGKQPGEHLGQHYPRPWLARVLKDPYRGIPASPRKTFLLLAVLPVILVALGVLVALLAALNVI